MPVKESSEHQLLEMDPDRALFGGHVSSLVVSCYVNERPLNGLSGLLDWRFHGAISQCIRSGAITGEVGECVYFPVNRHGKVYHLILIGAGYAPQSGERSPMAEKSLDVLQKNLKSLRLPKLALSRRDFGSLSEDALSKAMKGVPIWILP